MLRKIIILEILIIATTGVLICTSRTYAAEIRIGLTEDTYVEEGFPYSSPDNNRNFMFGYENYYGKLRTRAFLKYSLDSLREKGIRFSDIKSATLNIYQYIAYSTSPFYIFVSQSQDYWQENLLNWNNQPSTLPQQETLITSDVGWKNIDITDIVKSQFLNSNESKGFSIKMKDEDTPVNIFWSRSCGLAPFSPVCWNNEVPFIQIMYKENVSPVPGKLLSPGTKSIINTQLVNFSWESATDENDDSITYQLQVTKTPDFSSIEYQSVWMNSGQTSTELSDGQYYWRIAVKNDRNLPTSNSVSETGFFEIDTTPPSIPVLVAKPKFTYGDESIIEWDFDATNERYAVTFELEALEGEITNPILNSTIITPDLAHKFTSLNQNKYYFHVRAIDTVGNKSAWSQFQFTIQDFTPPLVKDLAISNKYISPANRDNINDTTTISFSIEENNIKEWELNIYDQDKNIIDKINGTDKANTVQWPTINELDKIKEGYYFAQVLVKDQTEQIGQSKIEVITIDNTPPQNPLFLSPQNNLLTNANDININFIAATNTKSTLIINDKSIETTDLYNYSRNIDKHVLEEGTNTIKVISIDLAGNSSESIINITTDWTAPASPTLSFQYDEKNHNILLQIDSTDYKKVEIYNLAGLHKITNQTDNPTQVVTSSSYESTFTFYVILIDTAGNRSLASQKYSFSTPKAPQVLGIGTIKDPNYIYPVIPSKAFCKYRYNETTESFSTVLCSKPGPEINYASNITFDKTSFQIEVSGSSNPYIDIELEVVKCKSKSFWEPLTWFQCIEIPVKTGKMEIRTADEIFAQIDLQSFIPKIRTTENTYNFKIDFDTNGDRANNELKTYSENFYSIKLPNGKWIDQQDTSQYSNTIKIPIATYNPIGNGDKKYFRFPFNKIIGVTQWYGNTVFQKPHTGIDFGAYREQIFAVADGYITDAGWDSYYGDCLSGGNRIKIAHDNGMNSVFAHLTNYKKYDGSDWKIGERVKKGDLIGVTGNTGKYNCEDLGYHLHFELRQDSWQKNHVDPVPLIDVDWNAVSTLNAKAVPGRLTGNNPHPNF